jgi:hypothetical protein
MVVSICKFSDFWDMKPDILTDPHQRSALTVEAADSSEVLTNIYQTMLFRISVSISQDFKYL